jgi:hypothetical protein
MVMVDDTINAGQQPAEPNPALGSLDRLVGTWNVYSPEVGGRVTFEWMEGGFFLMQHVDLDHGGSRIRGIEIIGYDEESESLKSHYFGNSGGILEYTYELRDDTLTIWFGDAGSPGKFEAPSATTATPIPEGGRGQAADTSRP